MPSIFDEEAWAAPATRSDVKAAASHLLTVTETGLGPDRRASDAEKVTFIRQLAAYDYSRAELLLAMREVPRDPERFGGRSVTVQDVHRVIRRSRIMRKRLKQSLDAEARDELIAEYPKELSQEDFKCCGFNKFDEPLYRYAPDVEDHAGPPRTELDVEDLPGADRQRDEGQHEPKQLGEAMDSPSNDAA